MTITAQLDDAAELPISLAAQFLGLAFPGVPGFKGQGWSSQETAMAVRWLLGNPAAWERAMATARQYPGNPHTVADTLHEHIVPRTELEAIAQAGGDPAKVNWLEVAHELIERRDDPPPAQEHAGIAAQVIGLAGDPQDAPDPPPSSGDPVTVAMYTAHRVDDCGRHLAHASERLDAARKAAGDLRDGHMAHVAHQLDDAHTSAHQLAANLRAHYPAEGAELDALMGVVGLAVSVSRDAKTATTAHLVQTTCNHLAHTLRHVTAMGEDPDPDVWGFNAEHARTHLDGALEHVGKLTRHLEDNYPAEAGFLAGLGTAVRDAKPEGGPETISEQANADGRPKDGTISSQALALTGDGHGHHIPGTPDVYSHGFIPVAGTEISPDGIRRPAGSKTGGTELRGDAAYDHVAEPAGKKERDAADYYSVGSGRLNPPLRNGTKMTDKTDAAQLRNLESAFAKAPPTTRHIVAYRGTTGSLFGEGNAVGTRFTDKGFTSISTDRRQAAMFGPEKGSALMEIHIPAGSKVVKPGGAGHYSEGDDAEKELVLNHGGQYEITSDETVSDPELGTIRKLTATYKGPA